MRAVTWTIYQVGHHLKQYDSVLEAYDMTTEAVVTKLDVDSGQTRSLREYGDCFIPLLHRTFCTMKADRKMQHDFI